MQYKQNKITRYELILQIKYEIYLSSEYEISNTNDFIKSR